MTTATKPRELPIIFSTPMVRAILDDRKTQTRRVIKPSRYMQKYAAGKWGGWDSPIQANEAAALAYQILTTQGERRGVQPGDLLWVKETWAEFCRNESCFDGCTCEGNDTYIEYKADSPRAEAPGGWDELPIYERPPWGRWKSPRFMPKRAARIWLEVIDVRAERVQDISEADAKAEGFESVYDFLTYFYEVNKHKIPAGSSPWVFAYTFKRVEREDGKG